MFIRSWARDYRLNPAAWTFRPLPTCVGPRQHAGAAEGFDAGPKNSSLHAPRSRGLPHRVDSVGSVSQAGVVTYTTTLVDTGEQKVMFGTTARHLKKTVVTEPDANACDKRKEVVETDGWYVDAPPALACSTPIAATRSSTSTSAPRQGTRWPTL